MELHETQTNQSSELTPIEVTSIHVAQLRQFTIDLAKTLNASDVICTQLDYLPLKFQAIFYIHQLGKLLERINLNVTTEEAFPVEVIERNPESLLAQPIMT